MSWKKSVFSNLMWAAYTLITGLAILELSAVAVNYFRGPAYMGPVLALVIVVLVDLCAYLFHRLSAEPLNAVQGGVSSLLVGEAIFVVLFLILGLVLRMDRIANAGTADGYYEAAKVVEGQSVPEFVHGAIYFYLHLLHTIFVLLGNKLIVGIWLQVILQLFAILILYFGVRKLAGVLPAIVMILFFTCAKPAILGALTLSPEPLHLLLFAIGLNMLAACSGGAMSPALFMLAGIWIGLIGYLDITGFLLLFFEIAIVLAEREKKTTAMTRITAFILCVGGILIGFLEAILADTFISGKSFAGVINAWWALYRPGDYGFSTIELSDGLFWAGPLFIIMFFGVFSYWYSREREHISMWMFIVCITAAAQYFGMLTEELPSNMYLLLCMTVLAGIGIKACFSSQVNVKAQVQERLKVKKQLQIQEQLQVQGQVQEPMVERVDERAEEKDMGTPEVDGVKLPEYLPEPVKPNSKPQENSKPNYIENPLPLPKPHQKKVLDYNVEPSGYDDFDHPVDENDDFDIQ